MVLVTIAIPTRNRVEYLRGAIQSALSQDYAQLEVIVSDNASDDGTWAYLQTLRDPRVRIQRHETNCGMVGNWNSCLAVARGGYFVLLSDDDVLGPSFVREAVRRLADSEELTIAYARTTVLDVVHGTAVRSQLAPAVEPVQDFIFHWFKQRREAYPCATMIRINMLRALGGYDTTLAYAADIAVFVRLPIDGHVGFIEEVSATYRYSPQSLSMNLASPLQDEEQLLQLALQKYPADSPQRKVLTRLGKRRLARVLAGKMLLARALGRSRGAIWAETRPLFRHLRADPRAASTALAALCLPTRAAIGLIHSFRRMTKDGHAPEGGAAV